MPTENARTPRYRFPAGELQHRDIKDSCEGTHISVHTALNIHCQTRMRYSSYLSSFAIILAASVAASSAHSTLPPPHFTALFTGKGNQTSHVSTEGPFGERYHWEAGG